MGLWSGRLTGAVILALCLVSPPALAQDEAGALCDQLAANPLDTNVPEGTGVTFGSMDAPAAIDACLAATEADAGDGKRRYQLARAYDVAGQFDAAIEDYQSAADLGYAMALNSLGALHEGGFGFDVDMEKAAGLYQQAADAGIVVGKENLARLFQYGNGVPQSYVRAAELYSEGAEAGSAWSHGSLGWLTEKGFGVAKDEVEALRLYQIAAEGGVDFAQNNLGAMYAQGRAGLERDDEEAVRYYRLAAEQGYALAYSNLAWHYSHGDGVERDVAVAEDYLLRAIAEGDEKVQGDARNDLAWLFVVEETRLDEAEALAREAVAAGPDEASRLDTLAWVLHLRGDNQEALPLIEKAVALEPFDLVIAQHRNAIAAALGK